MAGCTGLYMSRKKCVILLISIASIALILRMEYFLCKLEMTKPAIPSSKRSTFTEGETSKLENTTTEFFLDKSVVARWGGFGPERGQYNFTVVTGMMDVGRGHWSHQARPYHEYLHNMERVLRLDVNIIAFVDAKARPFVEWMRRGRESHTRVIELKLQDLPYYAYRDRIQEIINSDEYRKDNQLVRRDLCESKYPDYNILQWSKLYFVHQAIETNPFQTDFFIWLDGGYGHGKDVHPHDGIWRPKNIFEFPDKVTFIELKPIQKYRDKLGRLHKLDTSVLAGLFWGGGAGALQQLYKMQQQLLADWMREGIQDDDQTVYVLLYFKRPDLFHLVKGKWYDVFKRFN